MRRIFFLQFFTAVLLASSAVLAQTSIAVVDVQALLTKSDAAISVEKQIDDYKDIFVKEISKQEQELRDLEKSLGEQRKSLSNDDFANKAKAFEEKLIETRKSAEQKRRAFDKASAKALDTLRETLYSVVQELAREKGFTLVISKQNVIVGEQSIDLTEETMERLNKKISTIALEISDN
jgi:outer membrane protein